MQQPLDLQFVNNAVVNYEYPLSPSVRSLTVDGHPAVATSTINQTCLDQRISFQKCHEMFKNQLKDLNYKPNSI